MDREGNDTVKGVMDVSKEYIKQCDCPEIQGLKDKPKSSREDHNWVDGDYFVNHRGGISVYCEECQDEFGPWSTMPDWIFLPRQDQLQDMYGNKWVDTMCEFGIWINDDCADGWYFENENKLGSMEQLWLAFVMQEKYNKTWNGEAWR